MCQDTTLAEKSAEHIEKNVFEQQQKICTEIFLPLSQFNSLINFLPSTQTYLIFNVHFYFAKIILIRIIIFHVKFSLKMNSF